MKKANLPQPLKKAGQSFGEWLKSHKAGEIEEVALLGGLAVLGVEALKRTKSQQVTEKVLTGYRKEAVYAPDYQWFSPSLRRESGDRLVGYRDVPIYENRTKTVTTVERHWQDALVGPVALKMAQSQNLAAGTAGMVTLGVLGLIGAIPGIDAALGLPQPASNPVQQAANDIVLGIKRLTGFPP